MDLFCLQYFTNMTNTTCFQLMFQHDLIRLHPHKIFLTFEIQMTLCRFARRAVSAVVSSLHRASCCLMLIKPSFISPAYRCHDPVYLSDSTVFSSAPNKHQVVTCVFSELSFGCSHTQLRSK